MILLVTARDLAAAVSVSAFDIGIAIGPWLGGLVLEATDRPLSASWVGVVLAGAAVLVVTVAARLDHRARPPHCA